MSGVCFAFQRGSLTTRHSSKVVMFPPGECTRGGDCRYAHEASADGGGDSWRAPRRSAPCHAFARGWILKMILPLFGDFFNR